SIPVRCCGQGHVQAVPAAIRLTRAALDTRTREAETPSLCASARRLCAGAQGSSATRAAASAWPALVAGALWQIGRATGARRARRARRRGRGSSLLVEIRQLGIRALAARRAKAEGAGTDEVVYETEVPKKVLPFEALQDLGDVSRSLWPLLMAAAEAESADLASGSASRARLSQGAGAGEGGEALLAPALNRAAKGLAAWQTSLTQGRVWGEAEGANWPSDKSLRTEWSDLLKKLQLPQLTRKYPKLVEPLLASLLETVETFHQENQEQQQGESGEQGDEGDADEDQEGSDDSAEGGEGTAENGSEESEEKGDDGQPSGEQAESEQKDGEQQGEDQAKQGQPKSGEQSQENKAGPQPQEANAREERAARAAGLMEALSQQWGSAADAFQAADGAFGPGAGNTLASGLTGADALWRETEAWKEVAALRGVLTKSPELRELIRNLGRRSATRGALRRLPQEVSKEAAPLGVVRSSAAPAEANGVCLSGDWETMLPSEAQLLASKRPMLRALHHARHIERSLLSYDRMAWLEEEARQTRKNEMRPFGKAGPLIVCLDTSGSMQGARETLSKALVLECLRQAQKQHRRCYLYAFSGQGDLQELELGLTTDGLRQLLDFLKFSFCGGTSLDGALEASTKRLAEESWRNADLLVVTDGEIGMPHQEVLGDLERACAVGGARLVGIVLGSDAGATMEQICTELYITGPAPDDVQRRPWDAGTLGVGGAFGKGQTRSARSWPSLRRVPVQQIVKEKAFATRATGGFSKGIAHLPGAFLGWGGSARAARVEASPRSRGECSGRASSSCSGRAAARRSPDRSSSSASPSSSSASKAVSPSYEKYTDELILVIRQAETEARRLGQSLLGTDSLLLGLLAVPNEVAPGAEGTRTAAFPGSTASSLTSFVEQRSFGNSGSGRSMGEGATARVGVPLSFTPMAQRVLLLAEEEQRLLCHEAVEPAHLLLALLQDDRGDARALLDRFQEEPEAVRRRVLATLSGPLAQLRLFAANRLLELREGAVASSKKEMAEKADQEPLTVKLLQAHRSLTKGLIERSLEAKLLLLAALSGEHLFLLGPPGTAKSLLARRLSTVCQGFFFERLLTRFSVPEEVFGPLSLKALENDELRRKVDGFLPSADVAFLDEVFKANSSILNALLSLLNERVFDNGGSRIDVPLWCAVAASNELPESDELDALFDRFLLRRAVPRVSDSAVPSFLRCALDGMADSEDPVEKDTTSEPVVQQPLLSAVDSAEAREAAAEATVFPDGLLQIVAELRTYLRDEAEPPVLISDRRLGKAVRLLRLAAHAAGASEVSELDLLILQHVFWDKDPEQAIVVRAWLLDRCANIGEGREKDMVEQARYFLSGVQARLRRAPRKQTTVATARRDLGSICAPLEDQLRARLLRLNSLRRLLSSQGNSPRTFWLETSEIQEARDLFLPKAELACEAAEEALREVLEMQGALKVSEEEARDACLDALLQGTTGNDTDERPQEELNRWASRFKLPRGFAEMNGLADLD
ncbi:unnamed protein product, partial [Polarella glacialis]